MLYAWGHCVATRFCKWMMLAGDSLVVAFVLWVCVSLVVLRGYALVADSSDCCLVVAACGEEPMPRPSSATPFSHPTFGTACVHLCKELVAVRANN